MNKLVGYLPLLAGATLPLGSSVALAAESPESPAATPAPAQPPPAPAPAPEQALPAPAPAAAPAAGAETKEEASQLSYERGGLLGLGLAPALKLGGSFSSVFSDLGTSPAIQLELGYVLPVLNRSLEVFFAADYTQPKTQRSDVVDTSGPNGESRLSEPMSYELTQQEFNLTLGALYRIRVPVPLFTPYVAAGGRLYFMKTTVNGATGSQTFGENREGAVSPGFYGAVGGELQLGPGAVLLEVQVTYAAIDGFVMRNTNAGAANLALGYRFFL
jgi:hypothetical protein